MSSDVLRDTPALSEPARIEWYLIRTKPHKERWVCDQLSAALPEAFLPMLRSVARRRGHASPTLMPLFPCYVFVRMDLKLSYFGVRYAVGVRGIVSAGQEPLAVPGEIVEEIRKRGVDGVIEIKPKPFDPGQKVRVVEGPFRDFDAIFDRYISGAERVAILLETVEARGVRVVLPAAFLSRAT
jgi:transcriptional antiterminator RfaH